MGLLPLFVRGGGELGVLVQLLLKNFAFDAVMPELVGLPVVLGPRGFGAVPLDGPLFGEGEFPLQQCFHLRDAAFDPLDIHVPDFGGGIDVAEQDVVAKGRAVFRPDGVHVLLGEEEPVVVELVEVVVQEAGGQFRVDLLPAVVRGLQQAADGCDDGTRVGIIRRGNAAGGEQDERQRQAEGSDGLHLGEDKVAGNRRKSIGGREIRPEAPRNVQSWTLSSACRARAAARLGSRRSSREAAGMTPSQLLARNISSASARSSSRRSRCRTGRRLATQARSTPARAPEAGVSISPPRTMKRFASDAERTHPFPSMRTASSFPRARARE